MGESLRALFNEFAIYSKEYPVIAGGLGLWAMGVGTAIIRYLPNRIRSLLIRHLTTTLTMVNTHESYHDFLKWYEGKDYSHSSRSIKISNGRHGYGETIKAMGYGRHYFCLGWTPIRLTLSQTQVQGTDRERDEIYLTIIGRSHRVFDKIFEEIKKKKQKTTDRFSVMDYRGKDGWSHASSQRKRSLDSVCLNDGVREEITGFIDDFRDREEFNIKHGISHQTAIMLYGPPGTGKTSVIKALASHYGMPIYNLKPSELGCITGAFSKLPEHSLIVVEDIDTNTSLYSRDLDPGVRPEDTTSFLEETTSMSDVLNAVDGLAVAHGRVLLATTNYMDRLDPALLRAGRFDLKIEIDYSDSYALQQFLDRFYPGETLPEGYKIKDRVCPADIQQCALKNLDNLPEFLRQFQMTDKSRSGVSPLGDLVSV